MTIFILFTHITLNVRKKYCRICEIWKKKVSAIVSKDNVFGYQFHPEKSGKSGLKVLKYFLDLK